MSPAPPSSCQPSLGLDDDPLVDQIVREVDHEQRIAFAPPVHQARQPPGKLMAGKPHREKLRDGFLGQVLERQLLTQAVRLQLPLDALQRMVAEDDVDGPVSADHHQPRRIAAPREVADEIERRVVAPVQIFEHHDRAATRR